MRSIIVVLAVLGLVIQVAAPVKADWNRVASDRMLAQVAIASPMMSSRKGPIASPYIYAPQQSQIGATVPQQSGEAITASSPAAAPSQSPIVVYVPGQAPPPPLDFGLLLGNPGEFFNRLGMHLLELLKTSARNLKGIFSSIITIFTSHDSNSGVPNNLLSYYNNVKNALLALAVPILAIGLALSMLSTLTGFAAGADSDLSSLGQAFLNWLLVAIVSFNIHFLHDQINAVINGANLFISGNTTLADIILPDEAIDGAPDFLVLLIIIIIAFYTMVVLTISYFARWVVFILLVVIAPPVIALSTVPFCGYLLGSWINTYARSQLLYIANTILLVLAGGAAGVVGGGGWGVLSMLPAAAVITLLFMINISSYNDIFKGVATISSEARGAARMAAALVSNARMVGRAGYRVGESAYNLGKSAYNQAIGSGRTGSLPGSSNPPSSSGGGSPGGSRLSLPPGNGGSSSPSPGGSRPLPPSGNGNSPSPTSTTGSGLPPSVSRLGLSSQDSARIESAIKNGAQINGRQVSGEQLARGLERSGPILHAMQQKYGGPQQAAKAMGQRDFADLALQVADAPDPDARSSRQPSSVIGPQMASWLNEEHDRNEPGAQTPYDFAAGAYIARVTGARPDHEPLWANTIQSARKAFGRSYVSDLLDRVERGNWTEKRLQEEIDFKVKVASEDAKMNFSASRSPNVYRFWNTNSSPNRIGLFKQIRERRNG